MRTKKCIKRIVMNLLFSLLLLIVAIPMQVHADEVIISLEPNESNLFSSMQDLMPGEIRIDYVIVENISHYESVFYMTAEMASVEDFTSKELYDLSDDLLDELELSIILHEVHKTSEIVDEGRLLYRGPAHQDDGKDGLIGRIVKLSELGPGDSCVIEVAVSVPLDLDSRFYESEGKFWWKFMSYADTSKEPGGNGNGGNNGGGPGGNTGGSSGNGGSGSGSSGGSRTPKTGDLFYAGFITLFIASFSLIIVLIRCNRMEKARCRVVNDRRQH